MGILIVALAVGLTACYSPSLRDCTVTCNSPSDCAGGQVCGADHFCAAPAIAGACMPTTPLDDGGGAPPDAAPDARPDARAADAGIDAPRFVAVHVHVDGKGMVALDGGGSCRSDCMLSAPLGVIATLRATPAIDQVFDRWTSQTCVGQPAVCRFIPFVATTVAARFRKEEL